MKTMSLLLAVLLSATAAQAQCPASPPSGVECVGAGANKEITAHSTCAKITNSHTSNKALFVPVNTSTEWSTFRTNLPSGVTSGACGGGGSTPTVVQTATYSSGASANTSHSVTLSSNCTSGNVVIVAMFGRSSADDVTSVSGLGATWTKVVRIGQSFNNLDVWYGQCVTPGTLVSITSDTTNIRVNIAIEVADLASKVSDSYNDGNISNSFTISTIAPYTAPSVANTFVFAAGVIDKQATFTSASNGFTHIATVDAGSGGSRVSGTAAYKIVGASEDATTTITLSGSGSPSSLGLTTTFK